MVIRDGQDDLDEYRGASFIIGNDTRFFLRVYRGHIHSDVTVTLYLPDEVTDEKTILTTIAVIVQEMAIPDSAIVWKRGQKFQFGYLERSPSDRLRESEARLLILKIAATQPERSASIIKLREEIPRYFDLSSKDKELSLSRKNESNWHIVIRNTMSSHTSGRKTIFGQGWAEKIPGGLKVTPNGLAYLKSIGFLDDSTCEFVPAE